jgi:hypothetical protein
LFAAYDDRAAALWDVASGQVQLRVRSVSSDSPLPAISADGKTLVGSHVIYKPGNFKVWDVAQSASPFTLDDPPEIGKEVILASNGTIVAQIP